jgi:hypothetical protein
MDPRMVVSFLVIRITWARLAAIPGLTPIALGD